MKVRIIILFISIALPSFADEYAVISNQMIKELTPLQIRAVFLKKLTHMNGIHLVPLNLPSHDPLRKKFEKELLKMSFQRLKPYWTKQHYLGVRPPLTLKSQESVLLFTTKVQGAISYVNTKNIDKNVRVLYTWRDE